MNSAAAPSIVVVHPSDEMYGADRILLQVIEAMRTELGADVEVWLPDDTVHGDFPLCEQLTARGIRWQHRALPVLRRAYMRPAAAFGLLKRMVTTTRELRKARPDMVFLGTSACLLIAPLARLAGVRRRVVHVQERWEGGEARVLRILAKTTTARIAISQAVAQAAGLHDPDPQVILNCVDDTRTTPGVSLGERAAGLNLLVASRWNLWKGHRTLLTAWELAGCPGKLVVLGAQPALGEGVDVPQLVAELVSRPETVDVVGEVADSAPYVHAADAVVLPSDSPEPFGLVVIEAFAAGRPAIASRAGGPLEVIEEGVTGWMYPIGDAHALAGVLTSIDAETAAVAGEHARRDYEARFEPSAYRARIGAALAAELSA